jgi:thioredoxin-like negative regulator of GroEL
MTPLLSQEVFEALLKEPSDKLAIIYFTAKWCGPCKRIDLGKILDRAPAKWYLCDVDDNTYTPGYCQVKSIPSFLAIVRGRPMPLFVQSDADKVIAWVNNILAEI